mmetsp:Transcript_10930/g.19488  ORF Transcript_10930/g.19488 Transcript_10930/m.19488 type:complete len:202 (-) Transcript_10930:695-1300(-)
MSPRSKDFTSSAAPTSGIRVSSGGTSSSMPSSKRRRLQSRKQRPGRVRPALPLRCSRLCRPVHTTLLYESRVCSEKDVSFTRQESITMVTSSIVMEDSAMFVARITFAIPGGGGLNASICNSFGTCECSKHKWHTGFKLWSASRSFCSRLIMPHVGRKTSTEPLSPEILPSFTSLLSKSLASSSGICCSGRASIACCVWWE